MSNKQTFFTNFIAACFTVAGGVLMTVTGYNSVTAQVAQPLTDQGAVIKAPELFTAMHGAAPTGSAAIPLLVGALLILLGLYIHAFLIIGRSRNSKGKWYELHWFRICRK